MHLPAASLGAGEPRFTVTRADFQALKNRVTTYPRTHAIRHTARYAACEAHQY